MKAPVPTAVVMKRVCERHFRPRGGLSLSGLGGLSILVVRLGLYGVVWSTSNSFFSLVEGFFSQSTARQSRYY